jgi:GT2 family glycosyltransferase
MDGPLESDHSTSCAKPENTSLCPSSEKLVIHILTYNSASSIERCVKSALGQRNFDQGELELWISDNDSSDGTQAKLRELSERWPQIKLTLNSTNLGFCAGHNAAITRFLDSSAEYFLVLNPDIYLQPETAYSLRAALQKDHLAGSATPKLLRCDQDLNPIYPPQIDAAGMRITTELRHLDRGSGEIDRGQFDRPGLVFGGTGACLLLRRSFIEDVVLPRTPFDSQLTKVFPVTAEGLAGRKQLFDEAFFAYREDADLAWRSQRLGWRCRYVPEGLAYHRRVVVPERRSELPSSLNRHSVRNRFLLQLNHYSPVIAWGAFIEGFIVRNLLVLGAVILKERSSVGAFYDLCSLFRRSLSIRKDLKLRATDSVQEWFHGEIK